MIRLYYTSRLVEGTKPSELGNILSVARRRNAADQITGLLIVQDLRVLQFLEGPKDKVWDCYDRIKHDPRHEVDEFTNCDAMDSRMFSKWTMGLRRLQDLPEPLVQPVQRLFDFREDAAAAEPAAQQRDKVQSNQVIEVFSDQFGATAA